MDEIRFIELLEKHHDFPARYTFKFVVPTHRVGEVTGLFPDGTWQTRQSSRGRYTSVTVRMEMESAHEVVRVYKQVGQIEGVVSL